MLEIDTITVRYGADVVIDGLSWSVGPQAPVAALLGPSGCGKSTLLRAVAGLEPLVAGTIGFDGQDLARVPAHRRDFGVVFQDGQLFDGRSVAANVAYGLKMRRWGRREIAARVEEMLELVGLAGYGGRSVREISGGQAQIRLTTGESSGVHKWAGSDHYAIGIWDEVERLIWRADDITGTSVDRPPDLNFAEGTYFWTVSALRGSQEIARSGLAAFLVEK